MRLGIVFMLIPLLSISQRVNVEGADLSYNQKTKSMILYMNESFFSTDDKDFETSVLIHRESEIGYINGVEYGKLIEQRCFELSGFKWPMFFAFSTEHNIAMKEVREHSKYIFPNISKGEWHLVIRRYCYKELVEESEGFIKIE
jgi:hypothetical protein